MNTSTESFKLDTLLWLTIEDDGYCACLTITHVDEEEHHFIPMDITDYLRRHSVGYGYDLKRIAEIITKLKKGPVGEKIVVARGKRPVEGEEGNEDYRFRTKLMVGAQTEQKTDYRERGLINNVRAGQIIAVITKEVPGKPGLKVTGEKVEAPKIRKIKIPTCGVNVERYQEGRTFTYVSMTAGNARKLFNEIQVTRDFIVNGDLDYTKGNIDFVGNVGIFGDVKSGFSIKADGDIVIEGNVEPNAKVISKKNITVNKTIRCGMERGQFEAEGDITAHTVINSRIYSKGNVFIKTYIGDSEVYCEGVFTSSWGTILGSTVEAIGGIKVNKVGKQGSMAKNELYAGKSTRSIKRMKKVENEMLNLNNEIALIAKKVAVEQESGSNAIEDPREQDRIKQIGAARSRHVKQIHEQLELFRKELMYLQRLYLVNRKAQIIVHGTVFPTAYFCNGANAEMVSEEPKKGLTLEYREDEENKYETS